MIKVITYGTYDLLHYGHVCLLERAKALGDYLIVAVTSDDFDKARGKINVQQNLEERVAAVQATGVADKVIIEEYEGQKIDDIKKYRIDIFTVGSDWVGYFDYLNEYCKVVYLPRTMGVSSTDIRDKKRAVNVGLVGYEKYLNKVFIECRYVNGVKVNAVCSDDTSVFSDELRGVDKVSSDLGEVISNVDALYVHSYPSVHFDQIKKALTAGKHIMCESPLAETQRECAELVELAKTNHCVLMESLRTAYSTAYARMLLLIKGGKIGDVISIDATCTSLRTNSSAGEKWSSMTAWGPTALLPVFQILGTKYDDIFITSKCVEERNIDEFSKIHINYPKAVATVKVGTGVKSEGELIISGTKGYIYVPAPWWKTDYFEVRYENPENNRRYFYQLDGEGIRYEWVSFLKMINAFSEGKEEESSYIDNIERDVSMAICSVMEQFNSGKNVKYI